MISGFGRWFWLILYAPASGLGVGYEIGAAIRFDTPSPSPIGLALAVLLTAANCHQRRIEIWKRITNAIGWRRQDRAWLSPLGGDSSPSARLASFLSHQQLEDHGKACGRGWMEHIVPRTEGEPSWEGVTIFFSLLLLFRIVVEIYFSGQSSQAGLLNSQQIILVPAPVNIIKGFSTQSLVIILKRMDSADNRIRTPIPNRFVALIALGQSEGCQQMYFYCIAVLLDRD